jgi:hypothetical protein
MRNVRRHAPGDKPGYTELGMSRRRGYSHQFEMCELAFVACVTKEGSSYCLASTKRADR